MHARPETRPQPRRPWRHPALPFALPGGLGFLVVLARAGGAGDAAVLGLAVALAAAMLAAAFAVPWRRLPQGASVVIPLGFLLDTFLLLEGSGASFPLVAPLLLVPLLWLALHGSRPQLLAAGVVAASGTLLHDLVRAPDADTLTFQLVLGMVAVGLCASAQDRMRRGSARASHFARMASTDALTGIPNRRAWDEELTLALEQAARAGSSLCVLLVDFDHFKRFNDTRGHQAGDELLRQATLAWRATLRSADLLVRYGGEEFAVLLPECRLEVARSVGERLRAAVPHGQTCSVGIACWDGAESADALVHRADAALYAAKAAGRDTMRVSDPRQAAAAGLPEAERERAAASRFARASSSSSS